MNNKLTFNQGRKRSDGVRIGLAVRRMFNLDSREGTHVLTKTGDFR